MIGQVNTSLPLFAGFKIQNSIKAYDNMYLAETASAMQTKEDVAMQVINYYASLYKAQKR
jgi:outer membrane protein TolC